MNPAFQEALAVRLLWVDVATVESIEELADQTGTAMQAAYEAVHRLASNDVLTYRHYGSKAPRVLQDVPILAAQYTLAYLLHAELYMTHSDAWLNSGARQSFTAWVSDLTREITVAIAASEYNMDFSDLVSGHETAMLRSWSDGEPANEAAAMMCWVHEMKLEEEHRRHCEDIADTYASIEAELWAGWREDCEQDLAA